jgi:outer membrane protein OmpA-like peptidoglycan-associated protein
MVYQLGLKVNANQTPKQRIESQQSNFGFGKDVISPANKEILDYIAEQLKANPTFKLELIGHSDVEEDTEGLSNAIYAEMGLKRATKLKDYLVEKGIAADRLVISDKGYSEPSQDIYEDDDDEMKQAKNRRVNYRVFQ